MTAAVRVNHRRNTGRPPSRVKLPHVNSPDKAVIATDLTGKIVFWNSAAEQVYGWKWQEVIGRSILDLVVPDSAQPDAAKIMNQLRKGKTWTGSFSLRRRDGSEFVGIVTDQPMRDRKGNLIGIIGISHPEGER